MIFDKSKTICSINQKLIVSEEQKKKHVANNNDYNNVYHFKIDGDILPEGTSPQRCDFLLENETKHKAYLIELKGKNLNHAIEQIESTIKIFKGKFDSYEILPRIVYKSNTHAVHSSKVNSFKMKYPKSIIRTIVIEENI